MSTKFQTAIAQGTDSYKVGEKAASKALQKLGTKNVDFSIVFSSSKYNYQDVVKGIRKVTNNAPLIGCSTAGEFTEEEVVNGSVVCALISSDTHKFSTGFGTRLKEDEIKCLKNASSKIPPPIKEFPYLSIISLIDGLAGKGEESVLSALSVLGPNVKFAGCASADDLKFEGTYVFSDDKVATNAVSLAFITSKIPVAIGVKHGHLPISPPLTVTKAEGNVVYEIDDKPAFEVWKHYTRESAKKLGINVDTLSNPEQISMHLTRYEAGLLTGTDYKIRWPGQTTTTEGPITFACAMTPGTVLRIMESPKQGQIDSARKAAELALNACKGVKIAGAVVFDCVCRAVILEKDFSLAVKGIKEVLGGIPMIGLETYGEIAMELGQLSGFHNTTTVVLLFPE